MAEVPPSHFRPEHWLDYLRNTASADLRCQIDEHLQSQGCRQCEEQLRYWSNALKAGRELAAFQPSEAVLNRARAIFPPAPVWNWWEVPARLASLLDPGSLEPAYGFRSQTAQATHVLEAGDRLVRLRMETSNIGEIVLLGTISSLPAETPGPESVSVFLVSGKKILAQTRTTRFGEFLLEFSPVVNLRLVLVETDAATRVDVELDPILLPHGEI